MKFIIAFIVILLFIAVFTYYLNLKDVIQSYKGKDAYIDDAVSVMVNVLNLSLAGIMVALGYVLYSVFSALRLV